jgi:glycosyltransferase involved in cell wall biosynthesis
MWRMGDRLRVAITLEQCWHRVPGGTARAALESIAALQDHGSTDLIGVSARHRMDPAPTWRPTIEVEQFRLPRLALYESWQRFRRSSITSLVGSVDVIHATGMAVPPRTAPLVVTVHDLAFLRDPTQFTARGVQFFQRSIELARRDATLVNCPSQATIDECVDNGFDAERLRLLPWSIDPVLAEPAEVTLRRSQLKIDGPMVLWAGTIEPRKNLPMLLDAFARIDDSSATLVLAGPTGWNEDLSAKLRVLGDRVQVLGFVSTEELRTLFAAADVFCFPSRQEGFGLPVLEAMAQGTAVITSSGTATAEVAGDAAVLVDPSDGDAMVNALDRLLGDASERIRLGARARQRVLEHFSRRAHAAALESIYREAVSLGVRGSGR